MSSKPLNPALYRRLKKQCENVVVANRGEAHVQKIIRDIVTGKKKISVVQPGEYYRINCPFCDDTDFKCYVNHRYGTYDELGNEQTHLIHCFKANCPLNNKEPGIYEKAKEKFLGRQLVDLRKAMIHRGTLTTSPGKPCELPQGLIPLEELSEEHQAIRYLRGRNFDPQYLSEFYGVRWCEDSTNYFCYRRIFIPIYKDGLLISWQARLPFDSEGSAPKYFFAKSTPKRELLYNLDVARGYRTGVIVEGVTDVWRIGPCGMAIFGSYISDHQKQMVSSNFRDYSAVLLYDGDVVEKDKADSNVRLHKLIEEFSTNFRKGFCWVKLPIDKDPAMFERDTLKDYICSEAAKQGVSVDWSKR